MRRTMTRNENTVSGIQSLILPPCVFPLASVDPLGTTLTGLAVGVVLGGDVNK